MNTFCFLLLERICLWQNIVKSYRHILCSSLLESAWWFFSACGIWSSIHLSLRTALLHLMHHFVNLRLKTEEDEEIFSRHDQVCGQLVEENWREICYELYKELVNDNQFDKALFLNTYCFRTVCIFTRLHFNLLVDLLQKCIPGK